jgi:hypothetical protein
MIPLTKYQNIGKFAQPMVKPGALAEDSASQENSVITI